MAHAEPSYLTQLQSAAHERHLADSTGWHRLLHDRRTWTGIQKSDIDAANFFLSPRGRTDPSAELDATLAAFFDAPTIDSETQHPQCRFPARYAWLKDQLNFDAAQLSEMPCPRFKEWSARMNADSVSVVFASYYMNNPSSMYGHPFLLLKGPGTPAPPELLDYTVSFAADVTTSNDFLFAFYGLAGIYRGVFSTMPYYIKVREYTDMESRDLWEYDLSIDSAATQRLVQHLWELGQTSMAYYFFTKNCSYQILPLLEVADPSLHLSSRFHLKVIPADVLRAIRAEPGLVTAVRKRPSFVSQMLSRRGRLTHAEIHMAQQLVADSSATHVLDGKTPERKALVLDSAYDYFRYVHGFERDQAGPVGEAEERLLKARNQLGPITPTPPVVAPDVPPDYGHPSGRVGLAYGFSNHSHFEELFIRPAVQDQDDPSKGYLPGSQLEMFNLRLRYDHDRATAYVREFSLVDILSLTPLDRWVRHPSWTVKTGLDTAFDKEKDPENSLYYGLSGGSGFSFPTPLGHGSIFYALAKVDLATGHVFGDGYRIGGGGDAGFLFNIASFWHVDFSGSYIRYPIGDISGRNILKLVQGCPLRKDVEVRITLERQNNYKEVSAGLFVYL